MSMSASSHGSVKKGRGFTLLEVLISLVILAVGMLGMVALQQEALQYNHAAFTDSQAQFLLTDMAERIRANNGNAAYALTFAETPGVVSTDCAANACNNSQMAVWDVNQWRALVEDPAYLPQGESQIVFDSLTRTFVISIRYEWSQLGGVDVTDGKRTVSITTRI